MIYGCKYTHKNINICYLYLFTFYTKKFKKLFMLLRMSEKYRTFAAVLFCAKIYTTIKSINIAKFANVVEMLYNQNQKNP